MGLIPLEDAQDWIEAQCAPAAPRTVRVGDALGCVLARDVVSTVAVPPFANTAMDGYAVRAADTANASAGSPVALVVSATLPAGGSPAGMLVRPGEAIRIMTGAPMPDGADAIVPVENTERDGPDAPRVRVTVRANVGDAIRPAGEDVSVGQLVFPAGTVLSPGHLGVLTSIGMAAAEVYPRARVGVLSTGDEVVEAPAPLGIGQIYDSNRHTLLAILEETNCEPVDLGLAPDDEQAIESLIRKGLETCDALVTSGGVSMGDFDWVKVVLDRVAAETSGAMRWMQVAIKPAKPLAFGVIAGKPVFGLPGNPVSSMVSFELFARPALRKIMGRAPGTWRRSPVRGVAEEGLFRGPDAKTHFVRVRADFGPDGRVRVRSSGGQGSNLLRSMALANALAVVPDGDGVAPGGDVDVLLLGEAGSVE